jgi:hypothetical protein
MNIKRVTIRTPGKIISYREYSMVRTPVFFDMPERDVEGFKSLMNLSGIADFEITDAPINKKAAEPGSTRVKGLKKNYFRSVKKNTLGLKVK